MTRTVKDAALLMHELTKPDPRDYMALPYQDQDWAGLLEGELKGKNIGLVLDIGAGLPVQAAVREAITRAGQAFDSAGAIVEPVRPFVNQAMLNAIDAFFAARLLAEIEPLARERQERVLGFILRWCRRAGSLTAVDALRSLGEIMRMREKAVAAIQGHDFLLTPTTPITAYPAEQATPGEDPERPFEHIAFTVPFNMSEQPAASLCAGYDNDGLPIGLQIVGHRFDDLGVLRLSRTYEQLRGPLRGWPEP
jgi:Asp-tRNA(Asn)/Glu-tRNA(Gln) amidotransferase A subunit family amidase